ncbi:MAG: lipid-A-disaccharide synthase [Planctomycetes bacterium]|nr:lipid-A-disaccharide synthase [Planctomycetota bacterium]
MKLFVSAGEPSGDLHGANLIRAIRAQNPGAEITALGGPLMRAAGADILYPLTDLAVMLFKRALQNLPKFFAVANRAEHHVRTTRPDAVVLIDYPGFHLEFAKRIRSYGVPTYFFVPPQIWAWKQWRVRAVRKHFTGVLSAMPFEHEWFAARHVPSHYVGHPYFDELAHQQLDAVFVAAQRAQAGTRVALLPGSRNGEIAANAGMMLAAARKVHAARPDARFLVAAFSPAHADAVRAQVPAGLPVEVHVGRTPEIIELAEACIAVSGSVGLEMMYRAKPAAIVYRLTRASSFLLRRLVKVKYMSLVNLMAGSPLYPEFPTTRDDSDAIAAQVLQWLNDPASRAALVGKLESLRARVAVPGACARAAEFLLAAHAPALRVAA